MLKPSDTPETLAIVEAWLVKIEQKVLRNWQGRATRVALPGLRSGKKNRPVFDAIKDRLKIDGWTLQEPKSGTQNPQVFCVPDTDQALSDLVKEPFEDPKQVDSPKEPPVD